ncbi:GNAT family N-acetyltransferase [Paenibacillus lutrae]|uniref:GNAT family N-acetyltransferase n=1 Tax=Paenibacillus lutrae TaxID=2078573 RepID=A0A7X3FFV9_9BACL|nr:GNAT family N-acetyltransferase [Paenibacillus lutrae]MVO99025.1 GNAT family N-acetyltransferase [Paenibacillus lutrae]
MITILDVQQEETARMMLSVQIPSYQIEADLIGFQGIPQLRDTVEKLQESGENFVGFWEEDELAAFISYTEDSGEVDICRLVVHPRHFRKGIARKLALHVLLKIAQGRKTVVSTGTLNTPALSLYKSLGFVEVREIEVAPGVSITVLEIPAA